MPSRLLAPFRRRVPTVTQVTQSECGLCSTVALLRHHGRAEEISSARSTMDAGRDGLSATQLARFLRSRGMDARLFRAKTISPLEHAKGPVILYWEDHHFLVLESFDGKRAVIMDPAVGRRTITRDELEKGFSNIFVTAVPGEEFERSRPRPFAEWRTIPLLAEGARRRILLVALLSLGGYGAVLGVPMLTQWAVDQHLSWQKLTDLTTVVSVILAVAAGYFALHLVRVLVLSGLVALLGQHLMTHVFTKLLSLPYRFFTTRQPGELLFRMNTVNSIRDLLSSRLAQGLLDAGTLLCITVYLFAAEWRLGLLAFALFSLNALYLMKTRVRVLETVDSELAHLSKSQSTQLDAIVSLPTIKMGGYAAEFLESWGKTYRSSIEAMKARMRLQQGQIGGVTGTTQMFGPLVLLMSSLFMVGQGQITLGAAIAVQAVSATYFSLATSVFQTYTEFSEASRYMARINDIAITPSEPTGGERTEIENPSIHLRNVNFRYTKHSEFVLKDISLDVEAGAKVALVGASGSGKSTLGRIICGLHEPTHGEMLLDGHDIDEFNREAFRRMIGYIPQEVHLHNRTLMDNLAFGQDVDKEQVREYCATVGILDFVEELPMGLKTIVSEMGANFSGGQRQRLAIVRALLQRPHILVLDEATSSLDTINERRVSRIFQELGATQVIIAHRLATIRSADRIYVLEGGRVVEQGTHEELIGQGHVYTGLYTDLSSKTPSGDPL